MKRKSIFRIILSIVTFIIVFGVFWGMIAHWVNTQPEEPLVLFTGEAGSAFSKYFNLIQNVTSHPFYFLSCCFYSFLSGRCYKILHSNSYSLKNHFAYNIVGFAVGIVSLFISTAVAMITGICFCGLLNIDSTLRILWLIQPLVIVIFSVFIGILIYTALVEKEIRKLQNNNTK